jgi:raffinose/stachyose/melibiose transport system substrate-binding protein
MKKWFSVTVFTLIAALALAGCGKSDSSDSASVASPSGEASAKSSEDPGKKVKISFVHWRGEDVKVFDELIAEFNKQHPNIEVEQNVLPSEQYLASAQAKLLDGTAGDIFAAFPGAQFETFAKANLYVDLTGSDFVSNYTENLIKAGQKDGKQYALPYQLVYNQPIYNKTIFEKLNLTPPKDWEGFLALCETLKKNGYIPIAFPGADIGPGQFINSMMMNNNTDEDIWDKVETGQAKLTEDWFVKTLSQIKELNDKGYFQPDSLGTSKDIAGSLFAQEKAAMLATGSYMMATNKEQNPNLVQGLLAPITVPADQAVYEGIHTTTFMLGINANSSKQDAARTFLAFLSQKENAEKYANETGQLVTVKDVQYNTPELAESALWTEKHTRFHPRYLITVAAIEKAVTSSIQNVIAGTDPAKAAADAQKVVDQNLKK